MGYRSDSIAISRNMGPLSRPVRLMSSNSDGNRTHAAGAYAGERSHTRHHTGALLEPRSKHKPLSPTLPDGGTAWGRGGGARFHCGKDAALRKGKKRRKEEKEYLGHTGVIEKNVGRSQRGRQSGKWRHTGKSSTALECEFHCEIPFSDVPLSDVRRCSRTVQIAICLNHFILTDVCSDDFLVA